MQFPECSSFSRREPPDSDKLPRTSPKCSAESPSHSSPPVSHRNLAPGPLGAFLRRPPMVTIEYRIPNGTRPDNTHIRAVGSHAEALALSAQLIIRGYTVLCIKQHGALVMNAGQISNALETLDNNSRLRT